MNKVSMSLSVSISKQGNRYVAYSPALDISTSGKTLKEVKKRFGELTQIFIEELEEMGTTKEVLSELGWKKTQKKWTPPRIVSQPKIDVSVPAFA